MTSLSICAILLTVFDFSTYVVNKHLIYNFNRFNRVTVSALLSLVGPAHQLLYQLLH